MDGMAPTPKHARLTQIGEFLTDNPLLPAVAAIGFSVSFQTITHQAALRGLPGFPWLYPVGIDVGILALILEARALIARKRSDAVPRLCAWILTGFTIYVNAHGSPPHDWVGRALHIVMPALWVVFLELRRRRWIATAQVQDDRIPLARWAFMPWRTLGMRRRMVEHKITSYPVAVAREEALMLAKDLVRAEEGRRWRKTAPALLRHHLASGTLPEAVTRAAETAAYGSMPSMAEPVSEWVTDALTQRARMAVRVRTQKRVIEASSAAEAEAVSSEMTARQTARQKPASSRAVKAAKVRQLLTDSPELTREEIARKAGVSVSTVDRLKREMPTPLRRRTGT
jgi:Protein of unknown function (DUF2637)